MNYSLIKESKAKEIGIDTTYLQRKGKNVIVNENDILNSTAEGKTAEEKAKNAGCKLITIDELKHTKAKGGWK